MSLMFNNCNKLKEIKGINNFVTNKVVDMSGLFQLCKELEYLDLSNFDTSNVTNMRYMFGACHKLKEIKGINKFITNKVVNIRKMFAECYLLENLDLSSFNIDKVTNMEGIFDKYTKKKKIIGINKFKKNNDKLSKRFKK